MSNTGGGYGERRCEASFMDEAIKLAIAHLRGNLFINLIVALIAGGAACRTVAGDKLAGPLVYCLIGIFGLLTSQLLFIQLQLSELLEPLAAFRLLADLLAAYVLSLFIAALVNAINPN
jgi:uncharacterized membrane protein YeaQ/YmgE (transglycosylase-associated protein family)